MIGTTRRFNETAGTIDWTRPASNKAPDAQESVIYRVHPDRESTKLVFQMGTSDPERAVQAARLVSGDVSGIDVNAGCPKPFSTSGGMGAALLRTPDKLCAILEALVRNITPEFEIGISVKIRILETPEETEALVRRLCATGITGLTVHCRTTPMRPRERAIRGQLRMIAEICREAGVACLMNGDVESRDEGLMLAHEFGADGAMIATAAERNPSCFRAEANGGILPWREVVEQYMRTAMAVDNKFGNTKFLVTHMIPGKDECHHPVTQSKTYTDICTILGLEHLLKQAEETDTNRGLYQAKEKAAKKAKENSSALAAGGQMSTARLTNGQHRKSLSERNVLTVPKETETAPVALAT